jgi:hypothetical protein
MDLSRFKPGGSTSSTETKKCGHASCGCMVTGKKFCCQMCEDSRKVTDLHCDCRHDECTKAG